MGYRTGETGALIHWSLQNGKAEQSATWEGMGVADLMTIGPDGQCLAAISYRSIDEKHILSCYVFSERNWRWRVDLPDDSYFALWFVQTKKPNHRCRVKEAIRDQWGRWGNTESTGIHNQ